MNVHFFNLLCKIHFVIAAYYSNEVDTIFKNSMWFLHLKYRPKINQITDLNTKRNNIEHKDWNPT